MDAAEAVTRLPVRLPVPLWRGCMNKRERDAHAYLSRLLTHYAPECEPLPDLLGLCSQIDNLLARALPPHRHRCVGCDHRWVGLSVGAELCGDCWRKYQAAPSATVAGLL